MPRLLATAPNRAVFSCAWEGFQIALIVWVICTVCTVAPMRFQPNKPVIHAPAPSLVKLQGRIQMKPQWRTEDGRTLIVDGISTVMSGAWSSMLVAHEEGTFRVLHIDTETKEVHGGGKVVKAKPVRRTQ